MAKTFSVEEVAKHNSPTDCWLVIHNKVYDVTKFISSHPGGKKVILNLAGKDATNEFEKFHNVASVLKHYGPELYIGELSTGKPQPSSQEEVREPREVRLDSRDKFQKETFGDMIPYGDPAWYQGWNSHFYNDSHRRFRAALREHLERDVMPYVHEWDEAGNVPNSFFEKSYAAGFLPGVVGPPWPVEFVGSNIAGGVKPEEYDAFHDLILVDEMARCGAGGIQWCLGGLSIGLPPVMKFGSQALKDKVCRACLTGEKRICLAITEPSGGSDVANLTTTAQKTADGKYYIVNGEKKWITNGIWADYFTVAVRTGGAGFGGLSLLLIEKTMPGVTAKKMKCSGVWASGTSYITFEDVKVPVENLIGEENLGFMYIMYNFNHERFGIAVQATRYARVCFEEAFKYAHKRKTFNKRLVDHPVIRLKLAHMVRHIEATYSWLENITYQMNSMSFDESSKKLAGPLALLKAQSTATFELCAREAAQIFGGLAYTRGGQGEKVERLYREVRAFAIPGGSEEIMLDLGIRQAMRQAKKANL